MGCCPPALPGNIPQITVGSSRFPPFVRGWLLARPGSPAALWAWGGSSAEGPMSGLGNGQGTRTGVPASGTVPVPHQRMPPTVRSWLKVLPAEGPAGQRGPTPHVPRCPKGYGHALHTVLGAQRFDGLRGPGIWPLATFLLLVAHGDLNAMEHFGCKDGGDAAQAER